jgi:hypothetical protein
MTKRRPINMLKRLLGRHRSLRIGATIVGASALAIGFASPALAAQNVNNGNADNATAQNYLIVQGGSNTAYLLMQSEASLFNASPGCDLVGQTSNALGGIQPLDYGCPGLGGEGGTAQAASTTSSFSGIAVTTGGKKFTLPGSTADGVEAGDEVYDSAGVIPTGDPVKTFNAVSGKIKLAEGATGNSASDTITVVTNGQQGENGFTNWGQQNPFNDVLVEEPSYGSSNGVLEFEGTGSSSVVGHSATTQDPTSNTNPVPVAPLDAARSSRAPKLAAGGDYQGQNFVAYAEDAVSYLYWNSYNGTAANSTDAAKCIAQVGASSITTAELKLVWNETYTGGVPSQTWNSVFGCTTAGSSHAIYAYWAQNGSGTESTWATATGATFPGTASNWPGKQIIFENETSSILANNGAGSGHGAPVGDVMFFFSAGRYNQLCPNTAGASSTASCAGTSTTTTPNSVQLGQSMNGIVLNQADINNQLPGLEGSSFPGDRLLYNVYSNGSNPNMPVSSPATLNAISEDGFMCKPSTSTDIDPNTGATYRSEIDAGITAQGFSPLPNLQVEDGQGDAVGQYNTTKTGIPNPAWTNGLQGSKYDSATEAGAPWNFNQTNRDDDKSAISGTYNNVENGSATLGTQTASATAPIGYCITVTTDGDAGGQ